MASSCKHSSDLSGSINMQEMSWLTKQLLCSYEGFCPIGFVIFTNCEAYDLPNEENKDKVDLYILYITMRECERLLNCVMTLLQVQSSYGGR